MLPECANIASVIVSHSLPVWPCYRHGWTACTLVGLVQCGVVGKVVVKATAQKWVWQDLVCGY